MLRILLDWTGIQSSKPPRPSHVDLPSPTRGAFASKLCSYRVCVELTGIVSPEFFRGFRPAGDALHVDREDAFVGNTPRRHAWICRSR
jgi:hypothetical protein